MINIGLSIFVEDEYTMMGFCGTPMWVAPEVGTYEGPDVRYGAVHANRWACGQKRLLPGHGDRTRGRVRETLISDDSRSRISLKSMLDAYQRGGVKRIKEVKESDETQKRCV
jgi:hypothetical protein